ncbi:iron-siderophore ABC transporter substrate-binding protein [Microlunatus soli]|uniref:iron-siderophore ABC transporter substrate-binding protein n=1 Tax=Microlunatus soli TaxID=630515 RepID=UPI0018D42CF4|nr:iron-siderophore ABC transporter substrate-binding protein [Microlunatus soli]
MFRPIRAVVALLSVIGLIVVAGCESSPTAGRAPSSVASSSAAGGAGNFPVTVKHAFGSTTIEKKPERVVTWGFGSTDAALALGVVPVAMPEQTYGVDKSGVLPWVKQKLTRMGAKTPTLLSNPSGSNEVPMEEIAKAAPDVILANYSGITAKQYATLSKIAPTVAYPDQPWATPWRDVVRTVGTVLGEEPKTEQLLAGIDRQVEQKAAAHPQFKGKTVAAVWDTGDSFYVYKKRDPRVAFLTDLGMVSAPSVDKLAPDDDNFYYTLSYEQVSKLRSDVLLVYADDQKQADAFLDKSYAKSMQQVRADHVATVVGPEFVAAVSPPTALSLTWGIDGYLKALDKAVS